MQMKNEPGLLFWSVGPIYFSLVECYLMRSVLVILISKTYFVVFYVRSGTSFGVETKTIDFFFVQKNMLLN